MRSKHDVTISFLSNLRTKPRKLGRKKSSMLMVVVSVGPSIFGTLELVLCTRSRPKPWKSKRVILN